MVRLIKKYVTNFELYDYIGNDYANSNEDWEIVEYFPEDDLYVLVKEI
jgi:hypothetical protein